MPSFGERFKELRKELNLTQQELADKINDLHNLSFGKSAVSQYENNKRIPEMFALEKFADFFDVSIDYLLGRSAIKKVEDEIYANAFHSIATDGLSKEDIDIVKAMVQQLRKKENGS